MKKLFAVLFVALACLTFYTVDAQMVQLGFRAQTDFPGESLPIHNLAFGPELDVNIPLAGVGVSASAMFYGRYLDNKKANRLDDLYPYFYFPVNLKVNLGVRPFKIVAMAGPYWLIPLGSKLRDDFNDHAKKYIKNKDILTFGVNAQIGAEILKHYRFSVGYKKDMSQGDINKFSHHTDNFYLDFVYLF